MKLLIIGGSDAGIAAGLRARELDPEVDVDVLVADRYPNFSICGLPYWLGGEVADWHALAHRTASDLEASGLRLRLDTTAIAIDAAAKRVTAQPVNAAAEELAYDRLVIATGADPVLPSLPGVEQPGVRLLHHMDQAFELDRVVRERQASSVLIVGAGYIGLEMAEAFSHRGLAVTVVEQLPEVLPTVDPELGALVRDELARHKVDVHTGTTVRRITPDGDRLRVIADRGFTHANDLVLVSVGVQPNSSLAAAAGAALSVRGAVNVDNSMAATLPDVWAAGDCVHTHHRLLAQPSYMPLGTTAHKQGRVAGENAVGGQRTFAGSLGTQVVRVFDLAIARTGLRDGEAREGGFNPLTVASSAPDHKPYYPGAHELQMRWTGDRVTERLLGCQIAGHRDGQVAKRIDIPAAAIFAGLAVEQINELDLSYTPPFGMPWDALQLGAQAWTAEREPTRATTVVASHHEHPAG
jgi:NADPH-dependent 2,4-dienoyl-CoA reductase/sulfur reductase-like enzyme